MIRVYLTGNVPKVPLPGSNAYTAFGKVLHEDLRLHIDSEGNLPEVNSLPSEVTPYTAGISYRQEFFCGWRRTPGVYTYRSATGHLESKGDGKNVLVVEAVDIADAAELYCLIREGNILPERSFDGEQLKCDSVRSILKLLIDVVFRRINDFRYAELS